jgi:hypothetical protein
MTESKPTVLFPDTDLGRYLEARVYPEPNSGCWLWTRCVDSEGYGWIGTAGYRGVSHRKAYEAVNGPIPDGLVIDHLCRNHSCCNPDHLEPVTRRENTRRGLSCKGMSACNRCGGSDIRTEATTGYRRCRTCERSNKLTAKNRRLLAVGGV